jgi:hypothetical protein
MAPRERDSLPQVAQYLAYHPRRNVLNRELEAHTWRNLARSFPDKLPSGVTTDRRKTPDLSISDLITHIWRARRDDSNDPYWLLAAMPFPVFITTARDNLLVEALKERGKNPAVEICRWPVHEDAFTYEDEWRPSFFKDRPEFRPSIANPLVFYAFGHLDYPKTLVLTEDDYFDYLIGITKNQPSVHTQKGETGTAAIPEVVKTAICRRGLLFLGFHISDWEFRTLFRRILAQPHNAFKSPTPYTHVSVQLEPAEGGEYLEPEGARQYLNDYFGPQQVQIYWGSAQKFINRLYTKWTDAGQPVPSKKDLER